MATNTLFLIHCGFYDQEICNGIYEFHVNVPVAPDVEHAKRKVKTLPEFTAKKMLSTGSRSSNASTDLKSSCVKRSRRSLTKSRTFLIEIYKQKGGIQ